MESERVVCPVDVTLNLINKKWSIQIIRDMFFGKKHINEFKEDKPKLSNKVLSICLKELEEKGLIEKVVLNTTPVTTEYYLFNNGVLNLYDRNFTKTTNFTDYFTTKKWIVISQLIL